MESLISFAIKAYYAAYTLLRKAAHKKTALSSCQQQRATLCNPNLLPQCLGI